MYHDQYLFKFIFIHYVKYSFEIFPSEKGSRDTGILQRGNTSLGGIRSGLIHLGINNMLHRTIIMPVWQGVVFSSFIVANETPDRLILHKNT